MRFGIMYANTGLGSTTAGATRLAQGAEAAGFESLWAVEHVVVPSGYKSAYPYDPSGKMAGGAEEFDLPDPLIWLTFAAAVTATIKLGTGVLVLPQRNPLVVAKEVATLDHLSGGRALLGVGVGWLEEEFQALGVPFAGRGDRLDEYVEAMRRLWTEDKAAMHGRYVSFEQCISRPRPAAGAVPVIVGGHSVAAARRAGRLGDGFFPGTGSLDEIAELLPTMRDAAQQAGRDPAAIELTFGAGRPSDETYRRIEAIAAMGGTRVIVPAMPPERLAEAGAALAERFGMD